MDYTILYIVLAVYGIGMVYSFLTGKKDKKKNKEIRRRQIIETIAALSSAVIKANGNCTKKELLVVKKFLREKMNEKNGIETLRNIRVYLSQNEINIKPYCVTANKIFGYRSKVQIVCMLYMISIQENGISEAERKLIEALEQHLGISTKDKNILRQRFYKHFRNKQKAIQYDENERRKSAMETLGLTKESTQEEIKKAYRGECKKHHPDLFANSSEEEKKRHAEKMIEINKAYEYLMENAKR